MYKMLIVDDERTERECIRYLIEGAGFPLEIAEAPDGMEALKILSDWPADILFTDVQMPGMTGLELIRECTARNPELKTIIFSSFAEFEYARTAIQLGAENYILKPVIPKELEKTIQKLLGELEEARQNAQLHDKEQTWLLQYALQQAIAENGVPVAMTPAMEERISSFTYLIFLDFVTPYLSKNYTSFYEGLRDRFFPELVFLSLSPMQALLFLHSPDESGEDVCRRLLDYIEAECHAKCYLSVSRPLREYASLKEAYSFVEQQLEQRFWNPGQKILTGSQSDAGEAVAADANDDTLLKLIRRDLSSKDSISLQKNLDQLIEKYKQPVNQSQIFVKFIFSNLITTLYPYLPEDTKKDSFASLDGLITQLYIQNDILEILGIVKTMSEAIISSFENASGNGQRQEVTRIRSYIDKNYGQDLSVEMLASLVYLTPDYLSRLFKKSTKKSISQYIRQVRMEKASSLLLSTNRKIIDIGTAVGYPNYSYFCQSFREYYGSSPEKYRQEESHEAIN